MKTPVRKTYLYYGGKWCTLYADIPGIDGEFIFVKGDEIKFFDSYYDNCQIIMEQLEEFESILLALNNSGTKWEILPPGEDGFNSIYNFLKYEKII